MKISPFMDRHKQDLIKNQMNFIKSIVKPCFESLSSHDYLLSRDKSIIGRQLQENEITWELSRVDPDTGRLIVPKKEEIEKLLQERRTNLEQIDHVPIKAWLDYTSIVLMPSTSNNPRWYIIVSKYVKVTICRQMMVSELEIHALVQL